MPAKKSRLTTKKKTKGGKGKSTKKRSFFAPPDPEPKKKRAAKPKSATTQPHYPFTAQQLAAGAERRLAAQADERGVQRRLQMKDQSAARVAPSGKGNFSSAQSKEAKSAHKSFPTSKGTGSQQPHKHVAVNSSKNKLHGHNVDPELYSGTHTKGGLHGHKKLTFSGLPSKSATKSQLARNKKKPIVVPPGPHRVTARASSITYPDVEPY
jgi:hypothetical protein